MATQYAFGQIVTNGLVLALDAADRNSYVSGSSTWFDLSGNNNTGSLTNGPTFSSANGGSIVFDGTDDYVSVSSGGGLNAITAASIDIWVKWISTNQDIGVFSMYGSICARQKNGVFSNNVIGLNNANPTNAKIIVRLTSAHTNTLTSVTNAGLNWINIIVTFGSGVSNLYINSILESTGVSSTLSDDITIPLTIGAWIGDGGAYSNSNIPVFKIYNRALSAAEVLQNYNAQKSRFGL